MKRLIRKIIYNQEGIAGPMVFVGALFAVFAVIMLTIAIPMAIDSHNRMNLQTALSVLSENGYVAYGAPTGDWTTLGDLYTQDIYPQTDSTYDIGSTGNEYRVAYVDSVLCSNVTIPDDATVAFGDDGDAYYIWETADADANWLVLGLPDYAGGNISFLAIGAASSLVGKDWGIFQLQSNVEILIADADADSYIRLGYFNDDDPRLYTNRELQIRATYLDLMGGSTTDYFKIQTVGNVPTIYGTGAYSRFGDAAATNQTLASEDDVMISGKAEIDGVVYMDGLKSGINQAAAGAVGGELWVDTDDDYTIKLGQ